jgi:hypothetical protein
VTEDFQTSLALLKEGRYREAWPLWDLRPNLAQRGIAGDTIHPWRGEDLAGRIIVVMGEQGLGDEIMFARFIPALKARGAAKVVFACHPENQRVMAFSGADEVVSRLAPSALPDHIYWCMLASLPRWLDATPETLPQPFRPPVPVTSGGGVGFALSGNPKNPYDARRSLPPEVSFEGAKLLEPKRDTLDSFELVAGLDLVITVDTAWAHIGGSLGKPTWVLLPYQADWRWLYERTDSPWYPSVRLFRQQTPGDWGPVIEQVREALVAIPGASSPAPG